MYARTARGTPHRRAASVHTMFTEAAQRFTDVVDGLKRMTAEMKRELESTRAELRKATLPLIPPVSLPNQLDFEFDWAPISHAPMETNSAVAAVRGGKAEIWGGMKSPIVAQQQIAKELGLLPGNVTHLADLSTQALMTLAGG